MKKRKILIIIAAICIFSNVLVGCSKEAPKTDDSTNEISKGEENTNNDSGEREKLTMWHGMSDVELPIFQEMMDDFNATSENVEVELIYIPREELLKQLTIGNLSGEMADLALIDNPDTAGFAAAGVLEDVTDLYNEWDENQFLEEPVNSATYEDNIYGVMYASNCLALFYDEDILEAAGVDVPTTWEELKAVAEETTEGDRFGFAVSGVKNEESVFQFIPFLASAGGDINDIDSKEGIRAASFLTDLVSSGAMSKEVVTWTQSDVEKQFATGKAAMMINGPWNVASVREDAPDKNWNVTYIPAAEGGESQSCLGGENLCITKGANKEAAWEVVKYICGKDVNEKLNQGIGKFSARSDIDTNIVYGDDEIMKNFADVMTTAVPRGPHAQWTEVSNAIQHMLQECYTLGRTPEEAAAIAQEKINEINNR